MAKIIDSISASSRGCPAYPWAEWLDGKCRQLTVGADFRGTPVNFRQNAYKQARYRGMRVVCVVVDDNTIHIQAFPK